MPLEPLLAGQTPLSANDAAAAIILVESDGYLLQLRVSRSSPELVERLQRLPGVTEVRANGNEVDLYADRGGPLIAGIVGVVSEAATELHDVHIAEPSLENLFLHHTGRSLRQ